MYWKIKFSFQTSSYQYLSYKKSLIFCHIFLTFQMWMAYSQRISSDDTLLKMLNLNDVNVCSKSKNKLQNNYKPSGAQLGGGRGEASPALFWKSKEVPWFCKKMPWLCPSLD